MINVAKKFSAGPSGKDLPAQSQVDQFNARLNAAGGSGAQPGQDPFWQTGARALIRVAGRPIAVCQEIRWNIQYNAQPIYTIDTPFAWDIDIGVPQISATLSRIMDPTAGPEVDGLFATMQAAVHQPFVEMQVLDKIGTSLFFARGMFVGVSGSVTRGAVSNITASFVGVKYQHYVDQKFKEYNSIGGTTTKILNSLKKLGSTFTGGIL